MDINDTLTPFHGSNGAGEIETLEEFVLEVRQCTDTSISQMSFDGWTFTDIDFRDADEAILAKWNDFNFKGAVFYGCTFPENSAKMRGNPRIVQQQDGLPFKVFRSFMYTQDELEEVDAAIYQFYLNNHSLNGKLAQQIHDHFLQDALFDYVEGKTVVSIMGGHQLKRTSPAYTDVAIMAHRLARRGFVVASGGGPGAMEACNLGAYLFEKTEEDVHDAIGLLQTNQDPNVANEYQDRQGPSSVIAKYGKPTFQPSLSIPTYKYGHEPTNMFGTWVCKLFSNAIREDELLDLSNGGIIYTPGSAGTRQEIFQASCGNHYAEEGKEKPTIFYDTEFWNETSIPSVLRKVSKGRPFAEWISESDDVQEIVQTLEQFRDKYKLPILDAKHLKNKFWIRTKVQQQEVAEILPPCDSTQRIKRRTARNKCAHQKSQKQHSDAAALQFE